jgi:glycosyltransferase involved in cell wall biosynthesis
MNAARKLPVHVLMLVGDTIGKRRRTGIQRVVIETARSLAGLVPFDLVSWDSLEGRLRFLDLDELNQMFGSGNWPTGLQLRPQARNVGRPFHEHLQAPESTWLLTPEVGWHEIHGIETTARATAHCQAWGGRTAAIFYDLIPIKNPVYSGAAEQHEAYLAELTRADLIIPISETAGRDLADLWRDRGIAPYPPIRSLLLPDGRGESLSRPTTARPASRIIGLFGTVEPRKRQVEFIEAMAAARRRSAEAARWQVVVVGSVHHAVTKSFKALVHRYEWLSHHDYVSDEVLTGLLGSVDFTVFASEDEGYGLPISESLAAGAPCLCANFGSMAEIAVGGGCMTVDVRDSAALEDAVVSLCENPSVLAELRSEIAARRFTSWTDYASSIVALMENFGPDVGPDPVRIETVDEPGRLDETGFCTAAEADIVALPDDRAREAFIAEAERRGWPALLPDMVLTAERDAASEALGRRRHGRRRLAETERVFVHARQSIPARKDTRQIFLRVLISTFNRRDFVVANVQWILGKVFAGVEAAVDLVVVDGGSADGTVERLYKIYDARLRVVECPTNVGMLAGIREAARVTGAEYVWVIGDDDFIDPKAFRRLIAGLRQEAGVPFAFTNFAVYQRHALSAADTPARLLIEGRPVGEAVAPNGRLPVREAAAQTDNLFTAIYAIIWRADLLSAAYEHAFDGAPFESLTDSIPCTDFILSRYGDCDAYWHGEPGIVGNTHNSWSRHRLRWHGLVMPLALSLAREVGVDPVKLQSWARTHQSLLEQACRIAEDRGWEATLRAEAAPLAQRVFRTHPPSFRVPP